MSATGLLPVLAQPASKPETRMTMGRPNFIRHAFVRAYFPFTLSPSFTSRRMASGRAGQVFLLLAGTAFS
jgi:hypothetical protein